MISSALPQWELGPFCQAGVHWERKIPDTWVDYYTVLTDIDGRENEAPSRPFVRKRNT